MFYPLPDARFSPDPQRFGADLRPGPTPQVLGARSAAAAGSATAAAAAVRALGAGGKQRGARASDAWLWEGCGKPVETRGNQASWVINIMNMGRCLKDGMELPIIQTRFGLWLETSSPLTPCQGSHATRRKGNNDHRLRHELRVLDLDFPV